jgi:hypothetical protein
MKRFSSDELDAIGQRLEELESETDRLRTQLFEQVREFGFTPPRAEKSKRLIGPVFTFTLSSSQSTEIHDSEIERIREACSDGLFWQLFLTVTTFKLATGATALLAGKLPEGAPRNLRQLFSRAVVLKEGAPRLRIEKAAAESA